MMSESDSDKIRFGKTILVVDDITSMRSLLRGILKAEGYSVLEAESGERAVEILEQFGGVDLALLDISMPGISGVQLCAMMRSNPATAEIPIIIITAEGNMENVMGCKQIGVDGFVVKPIRRDLLRAKVARALAKK